MRKVMMAALAGVLMAGLSGCGEKKEEPSGSATESAGEIKVTPGAVQKVEKKEISKENSGEFYYSYNKQKSAEPEEERRRTTIDAYLNIRSPYERVMVTMMIKKLSRDFIIKCSPCHDDYANGVIGPSLLDKDGEFIFKRLEAFKSGEKKNVLMRELVERIDDEELKSIAEEIAEFNRQIRELRKGQQ